MNMFQVFDSVIYRINRGERVINLSKKYPNHFTGDFEEDEYKVKSLITFLKMSPAFLTFNTNDKFSFVRYKIMNDWILEIINSSFFLKRSQSY